jgi:peptidyl-prolyl cis-trans isomerase C
MKATTMMTLAAALIAGTLPAAPAAPPKTTGTDLNRLVIARINGDPVTIREVLAVFNDRHNGHSKFLGGDVELRKFLGIVLDDKLLVQEAYEIGLDQDPLVLAAASEAERTRVVAAVVREEIDEKARPSADDVKAIWQKLDTVRSVRQITVDTPEEAEQVRNGLLHGGDPDFFARTCSSARSRLNGGHLIVMWGDFDEEWENAVFPLQAGEISRVIAKSDGGFDVVVVESVVPVTRPELAKVKDEVETKLFRRRREARKREYSALLWARYHASIVAPPDVKSAVSLLEKTQETVVATWDGGKLTMREVFTAEDLARLADIPSSIARTELETQLRMTVNEPLVALDGRERNVGERPEIADEVSGIREYNMEALLYRDHIFKTLAVKDEDVAAYFEAHKHDFEAPPSWHVAQILLATEAEAKAFRGKIVSGMAFADAAKASRDLISAPKGGDLGWITEEKVPPSFNAVLSLKPGELSLPLHDSAGWHLVTVLETKERQPHAFDEVREQVKARVMDNEKKKLRAAWIDKLRAAAKIDVDDTAIRTFVAANQYDEKTAPPQHAPK